MSSQQRAGYFYDDHISIRLFVCVLLLLSLLFKIIVNCTDSGAQDSAYKEALLPRSAY